MFSSKRLKLILLPLWNGIKYEKVQDAREEILKTFVFLVRVLTVNPLRNFWPLFDPFVKDDDINDKKDSKDVFTRIIGIFYD